MLLRSSVRRSSASSARTGISSTVVAARRFVVASASSCSTRSIVAVSSHVASPLSYSSSTQQQRRCLSSAASGASTTAAGKLVAPPMVFIKGEEMTRYASQLMLEQWIEPFIDTSKWRFYDLSCKARDDTEDQVLKDAVQAGKELCAIFKEPTITPTEVQKREMGLKKAWGSPNGAMRRGWNGITISRDTIMIEGVELGFKRPVLFERHAVGGEYGAGYKVLGRGVLRTTFIPEGKSYGDEVLVDQRKLEDSETSAVVYTNPYDNVTDLAHIFYQRCLEHKVTPYIVTKKTVFKWQEGFWRRCKEVFDQHYVQKFLDAGLLEKTGGKLQHLISDAATMQIIRWTDGGFGMACHNYDGDMLTDEVAQCHRSPGFITSNLIGKREDGVMIKEFEASHGTVSDMWHDHLAGKQTSLNPLGLAEALLGAMVHSAKVNENHPDSAAIADFANNLRTHIHAAFVSGEGTRDISGPKGLTTEEFIANIANRIQLYGGANLKPSPKVLSSDESKKIKNPDQRAVDENAVRALFDSMDVDKNGMLSFKEFEAGIAKLGVLPQLNPTKKPVEEE